ncbi:MAG: SIS domain-containing protein [candidate division Zixibacteria bacterium]|nr:SIS domain-containing protein [candidate division Zixibacteria bacterium]
MTQNDKLVFLKKLSDETVLSRRAMIEGLGTPVLDLSDQIAAVIGSGGKLMVAGNGGLAAIASLFTGELINRVSDKRNRQSLPALSLSGDASMLTAAADQFGYEWVFARQIEGIGHRGDMFIALSTTGNPPNLVRAAQTARDKGIISAALLGGSGGKLKGLIDRPLIIPQTSRPRVREEQLFILHVLVELIERDLCA